MQAIPVTDPQMKVLFVEAMDIYYENLPDIYISQFIFRVVANTRYWTGWTQVDDNKGFLDQWQHELQGSLYELKSTN
jgi:hypothetical protein